MHPNTAWLFRQNDDILISHREPFLYLEASRVNVEDGRVMYWPAQRGMDRERAFNIPVLNLAVLLLGPGCSITSEAMSRLGSANVVVGVTEGSGTPLRGGIESNDVHFSTGASEYRPTQYMQAWASLWFDSEKRLDAAKKLLLIRNRELAVLWKTPIMKPYLKNVSIDSLLNILAMVEIDQKSSTVNSLRGMRGSRGGDTALPNGFTQKVNAAKDEKVLLGLEGKRVHMLYQNFAKSHGIDVKRDHNERSGVNGKLTAGNYLAYGLAASALYALGISFAFPLLHGKTRRGGLVFDIADILKDAIVVPITFALRDEKDSVYRDAIKNAFMDTESIALLIRVVMEISACS